MSEIITESRGMILFLFAKNKVENLLKVLFLFIPIENKILYDFHKNNLFFIFIRFYKCI